VISSSADSQSRRWLRAALTLPALAVIWTLAGCGPDVPIEDKYPIERLPGDSKARYANPPSVFGGGGLFGGGDAGKSGDSGSGLIGVNSLLWRASLDTVAFMPLVSADPFGGVIITDWYTPPATPTERFKVNIYILGRQLRADGIKASVFHQVQQGTGWIDAPVAPNTATDMEDAILTRARQMRIAGGTS
jgi:Domain of unknown function (DUF3576)